MVVTVVCGLVLVACASGRPGPVDVASANLAGPGVVGLGVSSCNGAPQAEVEDLGEGHYSVRVRTTQEWDVGEACGDVVTIAVDKKFDQLEITDLTSGRVFDLPSQVPEAVELDIDGEWEMVEVNGEPVVLGVNTEQTPIIEIQAGFLSGNLGCNGVGVELLLDGNRLRGSGLEGTAQQCGIPDGSEVMLLTERTLSSLLSDPGAEITLIDDQMLWTRGGENAVFARPDP